MVSPGEIALRSTRPFFFIFSRSWRSWSLSRSLGGLLATGNSLVVLTSHSLRDPVVWWPSLFLNKFHGLPAKKNQICTSISGFPCGRKLCSNTGNTNNDDEKAKKALDKLRFLNRIHINQTRRLPLEAGAVWGQPIPLIEFEVRCKKDGKLYEVEFQRGEQPEEFCIKVYTTKSDCLVATMQLEPLVQLKTVILRIYSPPGQLIGSVYELKGISKVALIVDDEETTLFQLLTNGGFGWTTVAKILSPRGERNIGKMYKMTNKDTFGANQPVIQNTKLKFTIHFKKDLNVYGKMNLLGACIALMGQSPNFPQNTIPDAF